MADAENVSMDAQVQVTQVHPRVFSREDELRMFALQTATRDRFHFNKDSGEPESQRAIADAQAYYDFLTANDKEHTA